MSGEIERAIVNHCSLVLLGCKPATLFMLGSENALVVLSALLRPCLNLKVLRKTGGGLLVLAFEKKRLEKTLLKGNALPALAGMGYPVGDSLFAMLDYLRKQFTGNDFPHEIGFFLGYPLEDVLGFVLHKGRNYKLCGYWKVYGDVEYARQCFRQYDSCRECFKIIWQYALITDFSVPKPANP
ncbi:MAG: DUF3793 family protein [Treponema sp.]|nr:DUF3793 family protein [Treponema sp.]